MTKTRNVQKPLSNYLRAYLIALGLTYEKAADRLNLTAAGLSRPANGERKLLMEIALPLWKSFGFPPEDVGLLYTKAPDPSYFAQHGVTWRGADISKENYPIPCQLSKKIGIIGAAQTGIFIEGLGRGYESLTIMIPQNDGYKENLYRYGLEIRDDSMNRIFPLGSFIYVADFDDVGRLPQTGDYVVIHRRIPYTPGVEITVKALQILDNGDFCLWPKSTNPLYQQPILLPKSANAVTEYDPQAQIEIKSLVIGLINTKLTAKF